MDNIVFPNSSYFVFHGLQMENVNALSLIGKTKRCPMVFYKDMGELLQAFAIMKRMTICFVEPTGLDATLIEKVNLMGRVGKVPVQIIEKNPSREAVLKLFQDYHDNLIPADLGKLMEFSANAIFPSFVPGLGELKETPSDAGEFHQQVVFNSVAGDIVGRCTIKVNLDRLGALLPKQTPELLASTVRECGNQFLGLVNLNLGKIQVFPKIGLPNVFDLTKIPEAFSSMYFPSVFLTDANQIFSVSLGYIHLERAPLFSLAGVQFSSGSEEVEFL